MNIGIDIKAFMYGSTGISRYIRCILDELQQIDTANHYYLFECRKSDYAPVNPNWRVITYNRKLPGTLWQQFILPGLLKKYGINVLWAPEQICPLFGVPAGTKIATTVHDFTARRYPKMIRPLSRTIKKILIPRTVKKSAALLPVSEWIKNELAEFYPHVKSTPTIVRVVGNAVKEWRDDIAGFILKRENFLFCPGNLEPRKNHLRLIKALDIVNDSGFNINLRLSGPCGWDNAELLRQIKSGPVSSRIEYLGFISDEELLKQYLTSAAVVFPSLYEGFGIPVLEALKLNTPVLTSRGTVMEEIAGENALYFDPYDVNSIAGTIISFLKTGGPVISRSSLDRYSWRRSAENLLAVFEELGQRGQPTPFSKQTHGSDYADT